MMKSLKNMAVVALLVVLAASPAMSMERKGIPDRLMEWQDWVLYEKENQLCPTHYNDGDSYRCNWLTRLTLSIGTDGGTFEQQWVLFAEADVLLPGGADNWPNDVQVNDLGVPVMGADTRPYIRLPAGSHKIRGKFIWKRMPEMISVPPSAGLIELYIEGQKIETPHIDTSGRLWLKKQKDTDDRENRLKVRLFRLLKDGIPMHVTTHVDVDVSGQSREIKLENLLLPNTVPMRVKSPLPAKIGPDGALMLQVRPGRWQIRLLTRVQGPVHKLGSGKGTYGTEIWSFQSRNHLRMTKIMGVASIEPGQTAMPADWKKYPAYILEPGGEMVFEEVRRGDPEPAPDRLKLHRTWWLDFNGGGYTVQDNISGTMSRQWYLSMNPPASLGRVSVDGKDQLITMQGSEKKPGVELRRGKLKLKADSRYTDAIRQLPAVGWDHDIQELSGTLNLPPGWRLLTAGGVDVLPGTWFQKWTLLDIFLALIIALAVLKLRNWKWGLLALFTMMLIFHEAGAPRLVWLHILAVLALLKLLSEGWFRRLVTFWGAAAVVFLLVLSIPFMVQQIRWGIYPQLEPIYGYGFPGIAGLTQQDNLGADMTLEEPAEEKSMRARVRTQKKKLAKAMKPMAVQQRQEVRQVILDQDPDALIQTGPGLPSWQWRSFKMKWNGPVDRGQRVRLWLISPFLNLLLAVARVILLASLIYGLIDLRFWWGKVAQKISPAATAVIMAVVWLSFQVPPVSAEATGYPPQELLKELQHRLLKKPECLPHCADIADMELTVDADRLQLLLKVHAAVRTAIPLPVTLKSWIPEQIFLDQKEMAVLSRDDSGMLWTLVPEGIHTIALTGRTGPAGVLQIPLPLKPHRGRYAGNGWEVKGIHPDGKVETSIQLTRLAGDKGSRKSYQTGALPPFLHIERVFHLGLVWQISTTVRRLTPSDVPLVASFPLMAKESVTTEGIRTQKGVAQINMDAGIRTIRFSTSLEKSSDFALVAPQGVPWTETWILDASPIWHCDFAGIPVIHHQDKKGLWRPQWKPWPGEKVTVRISRPKAVPGRMKTIDAAKMALTPGQRFSKAGLTLKIRTSRGGQHQIELPEGADLQAVKLDGKSLPVRQEGRKVIVPLRPGPQKIYVEWHQLTASSVWVKSPRVKIGDQAVNADVTYKMPDNLWILLVGGPRLGPAVLFWSYLLVVVLAAIALGRTRITPLKTVHWLLLGLGLTQISPLMAIIIIGWLLALGFRGRHVPPDKWFHFNITQVAIVVLTLAALYGLYTAIERGLLGIPDMQISGNGSSNDVLHWTQDRVDGFLPQPWALILPQWSYHLLMLFWSLWLAFFLLKWLRWGWQCFSEGKIWKKTDRRKAKKSDKKDAPAVEVPTPPAEGA